MDDGVAYLELKIQGIKEDDCSSLQEQIGQLQDKLEQVQNSLEQKLEAQQQGKFKMN